MVFVVQAYVKTVKIAEHGMMQSLLNSGDHNRFGPTLIRLASFVLIRPSLLLDGIAKDRQPFVSNGPSIGTQ